MFFRLLLKLNNLHSIKGHCFSTNAVESQLVSGVVDIPLAQSGEGIVECELLKWFVQEEAWEIRGDLNRGCTRLLSANTEQLQLAWFMGAMGDSFYEYLHYRDMWETSMKGLLSLVRKTAPSSFTYISEKIGNSLIDKMDELACFASGMIALGSSGYGPDESTKFLNLAEEIHHILARHIRRMATMREIAFNKISKTKRQGTEFMNEAPLLPRINLHAIRKEVLRDSTQHLM
ncbi:hypothetical protein M8C21_014656 [Ambrosia artemisiifolia]|uniref:Uncharacterized protein n=1 Tax=Ambrosia artemisiifolia TaxID=4212 RepID=A0AAD5DEL7_AMBAR|nr:hypothetical protein M8C21_014656 [Ambrosia artemisiifolia]